MTDESLPKPYVEAASKTEAARDEAATRARAEMAAQALASSAAAKSPPLSDEQRAAIDRSLATRMEREKAILDQERVSAAESGPEQDIGRDGVRRVGPISEGIGGTENPPRFVRVTLSCCSNGFASTVDVPAYSQVRPVT